MNDNAFLVSHNGLGDNLYMIGAVRYLSQFYKNIYFLCRDALYENIKLFFIDTDRIICIPFNGKDEFKHIKQIIDENYNNNDIFVCGFHKTYCETKITNTLYINNKVEDKKYTIDYDTITSENYIFIENFYRDIGLNLSVYFDYFELPKTTMSLTLYDSVKKYDIIFIQLKTSDNKRLNITNLLHKYLYDENTILISNDINLYDDIDTNIAHINIKKQLCNTILTDSKIVNYLDIIINSKEIYILDSAFTGIILPLKKKNILKANIVRIILRDMNIVL
jgi:hypothetical protein